MENNPEAFKLLICGDVGGNFKLLTKKIASLNAKKGPFKFCLCVGRFFDSNATVNEQLNNSEIVDQFATTPIYVFDEKPIDLQLKNTTNITIVGSTSGIIQTIEGFRIVYALKSNRKDVEKLINVIGRDKMDVKGVDFLISDWPFGIIDETDDVNSYTDENRKPDGDKLLSYLAYKIRPRYHFAARENVHYQRTAYKNVKVGSNDHKAVVLTRFVSMRPISDKKITKSFHALCILPINEMSLAETLELQKCAFISKNPYLQLNFDEFSGTGTLKSKTFHDETVAADDGDHAAVDDGDNSVREPLVAADGSSARAANSSRCTTNTSTHPSSSSSSSSSSNAYRPPHPNAKKIKSDQSECWFCIGNEKVEKHYILHMKDHMYLTRAKGGLTYEHMIITSLQHYKSTLDLPDCVISDLQNYKTALIQYYQSKGYVVVFYERNFRSSHIQIHAIPVPIQKADYLIPVFQNLCKENNLHPTKIAELESTRSAFANTPTYFYIELPPTSNYIIQNLPNNFKIFFGRLILGHPNVLNKPGRINWRTCVYDVSQELRFTNLLKTQLKNFLS